MYLQKANGIMEGVAPCEVLETKFKAGPLGLAIFVDPVSHALTVTSVSGQAVTAGVQTGDEIIAVNDEVLRGKERGSDIGVVSQRFCILVKKHVHSGDVASLRIILHRRLYANTGADKYVFQERKLEENTRSEIRTPDAFSMRSVSYRRSKVGRLSPLAASSRMTGDDLLRDTGSFNSAECDLISGDDDCTARSDGNNSFLANCDGFSSRDEGCARMAIQEEDAAALQFGPVPIFITFPVKPEKPPPQIVPHPRSYSEVIEASQPLKYYVRRTARPAGTSLLHSNHQL